MSEEEMGAYEGNRAQKLIEFVSRYRAEIKAGLADLQVPPETPEEEKHHFQLKRQAVEALVSRVDVLPDRTIRVTFVPDLPDLEIENLPSDS
jgi:RAB protein geranylgeranyltransferase component A